MPRTVRPMREELDDWLPKPTVRIAHRQESDASAEALWEAAISLRLDEAPVLGRLVHWRIPGLSGDIAFDRLFREAPFLALAERPRRALVSGLVGRIWTLRRDYPQLDGPDAFRAWSRRGTARVAIANWIDESGDRAALCAEARVEAIGTEGRLGVAALRPLVGTFEHLIGSEALHAAVRVAESGGRETPRRGLW